MEIRLIAMDLDGTALQPDRCSFSPRLTDALAQAHRQGIHIAVVTGRQYQMLPPAVREHPVWEDLAVLCNGAQIRRLATGELLQERNLSREALERLLAISRMLRLPIEFSRDSVLYLTEESLAMQQGIGNLRFHRDIILAHHGRIVAELDPLCDGPVEKVNLPHIPVRHHREVERLLESVAVSAVWSSATSMEITHPQAQKGNALKTLCRMLAVPLEQTMAIGDSGNDISMLRAAGIGVAMGDAPDPVRQAADAVTESSANDGAAIAIERYALKSEILPESRRSI